MLHLSKIIGNLVDSDLAEPLHKLEHQGCIEYITLDADDIKRKRLRVLTDRGTDCAIVLDRNDTLENGSVLWLDAEKAIAIRRPDTQWIALKPTSMNAALELGYLTGNLHWHAEITEGTLRVAIAGSKTAYLERLRPLLETGYVEYVRDE